MVFFKFLSIHHQASATHLDFPASLQQTLLLLAGCFPCSTIHFLRLLCPRFPHAFYVTFLIPPPVLCLSWISFTWASSSGLNRIALPFNIPDIYAHLWFRWEASSSSTRCFCIRREDLVGSCGDFYVFLQNCLYTFPAWIFVWVEDC